MKKEKNKNSKIYSKLGTQAITAFLVFAVLILLFSTSKTEKEKTISLSELVGKINAGLVSEIDVDLEKLKIKTLDQKEFLAKKEKEASLTESLNNLGVDKDKLRKLKIEVVDPSSFGYYFAKTFPFLLPLIFVFLIL